MDGWTVDGGADGMDGNGRSDRPFHWVDGMDGGRGMDRHPGNGHSVGFINRQRFTQIK